MASTWPFQRDFMVACAFGYGMCVSLAHGVIIVSEFDTYGGHLLHVYSLLDGSLVRTMGVKGSGKGEFHYDSGGLCVGPDGDSVLVAEKDNDRVQQVWIADGSWARFVGQGVLKKPQFVDCNTDAVVVSEDCLRISVFSWADGSVRAQFGNDMAQLDYTFGIRLLADGSGFVVADYYNHRVCVFTFGGELVATLGDKRKGKEKGLCLPHDVMECAADGGFLVANLGGNELVKFSRDGAKVASYNKKTSGIYEFDSPFALAALPDDGVVVRGYARDCIDAYAGRIQVFRGRGLRKTWVTACVATSTREWRKGATTKRQRVKRALP
jgi:hypothetical protein